MRRLFFGVLVASIMVPQIMAWNWFKTANTSSVEVEEETIVTDTTTTSTTTEDKLIYLPDDTYDETYYYPRSKKSRKSKRRSTSRTTSPSTSTQSTPVTTTSTFPTSLSTTTTTAKVLAISPSSTTTTTKMVSKMEETAVEAAPASILQNEITTTTTTNTSLPSKPVVPIEESFDDGDKDAKFALIDKSIAEGQERLKNFQQELHRSSLEISYVVLVNLQSNYLVPLQNNLSSLLLEHECRTTYWHPLTSAGPENDPKSCPTSPEMVENQIIEFEEMLEVNRQFRLDVHAFQNTFNDELQQLHESYANALRLCAENESTDRIELGQPATTTLDEHPPLSFLPPLPSSADLETKSSTNNNHVHINKNNEIVLSAPSTNKDLTQSRAHQQNAVPQNSLSKQLSEIESLRSSSPTKIAKFKALITEIKAKGLQDNPDLFRLASSVKNTRCRSDALTLKPEFPTIVQELIWSEKLLLLVEKDEKIFKLCVNRTEGLVAVQVTTEKDKEEYGQFWRFSPVFKADYFLLYNAFRRVVVGAGPSSNNSTDDDDDHDSVTIQNVQIMTENGAGRDLALMPREFMWKVQLSCPRRKEAQEELLEKVEKGKASCADNSLLISIMNAQYPNFSLDVNSLGNVQVSQTTVGHFSVVPSSQYPIFRKTTT